jgi:hypothetical protein
MAELERCQSIWSDMLGLLKEKGGNTNQAWEALDLALELGSGEMGSAGYDFPRDFRSIDASPAVTANGDDLESIANRIRERIKRTNADIIAIGRDLILARGRLGHGKFLPWIEAEFSMTDRTARNFMRTAEVFRGKSETVSDLPATVLYILSAPSTPKEVRDAVVKRAASGERVKTKDVTAAIAARAPHQPAKKFVDLAALAGRQPRLVLPSTEAIQRFHASREADGPLIGRVESPQVTQIRELIKERDMSCCRFRGRSVKLIRPSFRTRPG